MKIVLEGLLQSTLIISLAVVLYLLLLKKLGNKIDPNIIVYTWKIIILRMIIIVPILYFRELIVLINNCFDRSLEISGVLAEQAKGTFISLEISRTAVEPAFMIWLIAALVFILIHFINNHYFLRKMKINSNYAMSLSEYCKKYEINTSKKTDNVEVWKCKGINSPILAGFGKKYLFIPDEESDNQDMQMMLKHELMHINRNDLFTKQVLIIVNAIHWFNPLAYLVQREVSQYLEIACDYNATKSFSKEEKKEYMELLCFAAENRNIGRNGFLGLFSKASLLEKRIKNIIADKKKNKISLIITIISFIMLLQPFVYIDVFLEPYEKSYIKVQETDGKSAIMTTVPLSELYFEKNNGKKEKISETDSIVIEGSDSVEFYYDSISLKEGDSIFIKLDIYGNNELVIDFNQEESEVYRLSKGEIFYLQNDSELKFIIKNYTSDKSIIY